MANLDFENFAGNRIYLLDEEQLDKNLARKFILKDLRPKKNSKGLSTRKNPNIGEQGAFNLEDVCTDAVVRIIMNKFNYFTGESLYYFLNPSEIGRTDTSYKKKLPLITKILESFYSEFYGGHHSTLYAGNIPDNTSSRIFNNPNKTDFFWFEYHGLEEMWEVLYSTNKSNTKFLFKNIYSSGFGKKKFEDLRKIHKKENLFKDSCVSFIKHIGHGWYIPILGVTEIIGLFAEPHDFTIWTTLSKESESCKEVESKQFNKKWLLPKGYTYHDK